MIRIANEPQKSEKSEPKSEKAVEKLNRPPRTKRLPLPRLWRTLTWVAIILIVAGVIITFVPTTRWVEGNGFITTSDDAELRPSVEGVIEEWCAHSGDHVEKDQVIIRLNSTVQRADYEQAMSELGAKKAELAQLLSAQELDRAQRKEQVDRAEQNVKLADAYATRMRNGGFSPKEVEESELKLQIAQSQLAELKLPRETVMAGSVRVLREQIEATTKRAAAAEAQMKLREVHSPLAGMIQLNRFEPGEVVKPEHVLGQVFDRDSWVVKLKLPEESIGHVSEGQAVQVAASAYPTLRYGYLTANVSRIMPVVTPRQTGNGVFLVEATLKLPSDRTIQPGMTAVGYVDAGKTSWLYRVMGW